MGIAIDYCDIVCSNQSLPSIRLIVISTCRSVSHLMTPDDTWQYLTQATTESKTQEIIPYFATVFTSMEHVLYGFTD